MVDVLVARRAAEGAEIRAANSGFSETFRRSFDLLAGSRVYLCPVAIRAWQRVDLLADLPAEIFEELLLALYLDVIQSACIPGLFLDADRPLRTARRLLHDLVKPLLEIVHLSHLVTQPASDRAHERCDQRLQVD